MIACPDAGGRGKWRPALVASAAAPLRQLRNIGRDPRRLVFGE
jgi:hypothetical protein